MTSESLGYLSFGGATVALAVGLAASTSAGAASTAATDDEAIVVTGERPANEASSGTKSDTPLLETPQSISVISNADIAGLGLQNLNQALRYVAGVTPETRGSAAEVYDLFTLRGFTAPTYLDGLKQFSSGTGYAAPQVDVSRLDSIEVVKGPASVLYGQSSPGGLVAQISKLPIERDFYGSVAGTYGTYDLYRVDADVGGRFSSSTLWRVYGSVNGANQQQTYGKRRRETASGAITLGAGTPTSFTVLAAYSHDPYNGDYGGWPLSGTLLPNSNGKVSTKLYMGEPNDRWKREQAGLTYIFRHDFGGGWKFRASGRYQYVSSQQRLIYGSSSGAVDAATNPDPTLYARGSYAVNEKLNNWTFDNQLAGKIETGPIAHSLLFGVDRQMAHTYELAAFGSATPIEVYNSVYGTMPTPGSPYTVPGYDADFGYDPTVFVTPNVYTMRQRQQGIYAQDQIAVGGLRVTLSGRQDWARQYDGSTVQHDKKFTYRAGVLYLTPFGLAPYASYSTSFEPQSAQLIGGGIAKPSLGKQVEAGAKYQVPGTQIFITGAWFNIEQTNFVVYDPVSFAAYQVGKVRSRGVEVEAKAPLPYGFNARLAFSGQKVRVLDDVEPARVGQPLVSSGRGGITANLEWAPKSGPAEGLAIGGGVRHVDRVYADIYTDPITQAQSPKNTPSYTLFDALIRYNLGKLSPKLTNVQLSVNATNIFDKKYLTSCMANYNWCWYGQRRTVQGTIGFSW